MKFLYFYICLWYVWKFRFWVGKCIYNIYIENYELVLRLIICWMLYFLFYVFFVDDYLLFCKVNNEIIKKVNKILEDLILR